MPSPIKKRPYNKLTHEDAVAIVRAYHLLGQTQTHLAGLYGTSSGHICRVAHGDVHPRAYAEVFPAGSSQ